MRVTGAGRGVAEPVRAGGEKNMDKTRTLEQTKAEILRLSAGKRERALRLYEKAEFMNNELENLQNSLSENGWVEEYQNGANQRGLKKSSEGEVYLTLSKTFLAVMRELNEILDKVPDKMDETEARFFK